MKNGIMSLFCVTNKAYNYIIDIYFMNKAYIINTCEYVCSESYLVMWHKHAVYITVVLPQLVRLPSVPTLPCLMPSVVLNWSLCMPRGTSDMQRL